VYVRAPCFEGRQVKACCHALAMCLLHASDHWQSCSCWAAPCNPCCVISINLLLRSGCWHAATQLVSEGMEMAPHNFGDILCLGCLAHSALY
jgi:hypothetical protein